MASLIESGQLQDAWAEAVRLGPDQAQGLLGTLAEQEAPGAWEIGLADASRALGGDLGALRLRQPDGMPLAPFDGSGVPGEIMAQVEAELADSLRRAVSLDEARARAGERVLIGLHTAIAGHLRRGGASHLQAVIGHHEWGLLRRDLASATDIHIRSTALPALMVRAVDEAFLCDFLEKAARDERRRAGGEAPAFTSPAICFKAALGDQAVRLRLVESAMARGDWPGPTAP
jgi:hypothetical protein